MSRGAATRHLAPAILRRAAPAAGLALAIAACDPPASPGVGCVDPAAASCNPPPPPTTNRLRADGGDGQVGPVGTWLPEPIVVTVTNSDGTPVAGVKVTWHLQGDGRLVPLDNITGADGRARAAWLLSATAGAYAADATIPDLGPVTFTATGVVDPDELPFDELRGLDFATYDGSHQVVHPDYVFTPTNAFGPQHHLAITPYPYGNARFENPSLFDGARPDVWSLSPGVPNPIVVPNTGYLSDPDLVYVPDLGELWLYYRQVTNNNVIQLVRTQDGRNWSAPVEVARAPNHLIVSPSVVRRAADDWWMFSVNAGTSGCSGPSTTVEVRRSSDGVHWGAPATAALVQPDFWPWHIDVQWIPSRGVFWAVYNGKTAGSCTTPALFMASSADGMAWQTLSAPVLAKGRSPAFQDIVYRSTFAYDPTDDALTFWYSGARYESDRYVWSAAVERRHRVDIFEPPADISARRAAIADPALFVPPPAPLAEWP